MFLASSHLAVDHASLSGWSIVPTPNIPPIFRCSVRFFRKLYTQTFYLSELLWPSVATIYWDIDCFLASTQGRLKT